MNRLCMSVCCCYLFFFFQAEDGIRDLTVTGVQTCALPISKYSAAGDPVWSRAFGGGMNDAGNGVAVDRGGNVVLIGTAGGGSDFGGGPIMANGYSIVVAKVSPTGAHLWAKGIGDSFSNSGNALAVEAR